MEWVRKWMGTKPSAIEARDILRLFEDIAKTNGATISGLKQTAWAKIPFLEVVLQMLRETENILVTGGAAHAHGFLLPGRDWNVTDMTVWVDALQMCMVHPGWPGNLRKTAAQLCTSLAAIKSKPICELLWALGFSVPPNIAPHDRKNKRKADAVNTWEPETKGDRALLHQTRWQWNEKPFRTTDHDGAMMIDEKDGCVLLPDGAPLKKIWNNVRVVTRDQKRQKGAKPAE